MLARWEYIKRRPAVTRNRNEVYGHSEGLNQEISKENPDTKTRQRNNNKKWTTNQIPSENEWKIYEQNFNKLNPTNLKSITHHN